MKFNPNDLDAVRDMLSRRGEEDLDGLTLHEMSDLIYYPFSAHSILQIREQIPETGFASMPMMRLTEAYLNRIHALGKVPVQDGSYLPEEVIAELQQFHLLDEEPFPGVNEGEWLILPLQLMENNAMLSGLVKREEGMLTLTQKGKELIKPSNRRKLFVELWTHYTTSLDLSIYDAFEGTSAGLTGWAWAMRLLYNYGTQEHPAHYYAFRYYRAFPLMMHDFEDAEGITAETWAVQCFIERFFKRLMGYWGWIEHIDADWSKGMPIKASHKLYEVFEFRQRVVEEVG